LWSDASRRPRRSGRRSVSAAARRAGRAPAPPRRRTGTRSGRTPASRGGRRAGRRRFRSARRSASSAGEAVELLGEVREERQRGAGGAQLDQGLTVVVEPLAVGLLPAFVQPAYLGELVGGVDRGDAAIAGDPAAVLGLALAIGRDRRVLGHLPHQPRHLGAEL